MTTKPLAVDRGYPGLIQLIAIELATFPDPVARALETMADARSPLKGSGCGTITNNGAGSQPPPGITFTRQGDLCTNAIQATHDRERLKQAIRDLAAATRTIRAICNEWAPQPAKPGTTIWCENHLRYSHREPRAPDGSTSCRWCCDVHRAYGVWPTRQLVERHDRGYRISDTEMKRLLGKKGAA